jgi:hypothetical protein
MRVRGLLVAVLGVAALWAAPAAHGGDKTFFNGKNLDGWEGLIEEYWSVKDGAIVGASPKGLKFNTFLCTKKKYKDFEMQFEVRLKGGGGNSGVQVRSKIINEKTFAVGGPQADIGAGYWGSLYGEQFGGMMKEADKAAVNKVLKKDDFNDYYIKCAGKHVTIKVNGVTTVDQEFAKMPEDGIIALQLHAGGPMEVTFRNIRFTDLSKK